MPVLKFPGVEKTIHDLSPKELEEQFDRVYGDLPAHTPEEAAKWQEKMAEEFYCENAEETVSNFRSLIVEWERSTKAAYGSDSVEFRSLKTRTNAVREKLSQIECNLDDPKVKAVIKPLHAIWAEYRGWHKNDNGGLQQRQKPLGQEILSAFDRTTAFNL